MGSCYNPGDVFVYTAYLFLTWLPTYLRSTRQLTTMNTGYLTAVPYLATVLLSVMIGWVSDRTLSSAAIQAGKRRNFIASMALLSMVILFAPLVREIWQLLVILVLVLTGSTTGAGLNFTLASDLLRSPRDVSRVIAITAFGGNLFGLIAPIITGYIVAGSGGYSWAFRIAANVAPLWCNYHFSYDAQDNHPPIRLRYGMKQIVSTSFQAGDCR